MGAHIRIYIQGDPLQPKGRFPGDSPKMNNTGNIVVHQGSPDILSLQKKSSGANAPSGTILCLDEGKGRDSFRDSGSKNETDGHSIDILSRLKTERISGTSVPYEGDLRLKTDELTIQ